MARQDKTMQDKARQCKKTQGNIIQHKTRQDNRKQNNITQAKGIHYKTM